MIDYSVAKWITKNVVTDLKCSYCGKVMNKTYNRARLNKSDGVYCNNSCSNLSRPKRVGINREVVEPIYNFETFNLAPNKYCKENLNIKKCTECTLPECVYLIAEVMKRCDYDNMIQEMTLSEICIVVSEVVKSVV